ncbi:hypothetical protein ACJ72_04431 [Emergomyces africanus]|uniref:Uncharacterized protein n=1 Tax=Emergomyces africanus TaxID=1955775 RepID=A0A1B7NWS2_9EURO|nr:hypothetical protein ACJ72_04431 [Emergomyces africanus]
MSDIFCCSSISPFRPKILDHEAKFTAFMRWAKLHKSLVVRDNEAAAIVNRAPYAVQVVKQVNYGPLEWIRYFVPVENGSGFSEKDENDLVTSNFEN